MKLKNSLFLLFVFFFIISCDKKSVFDEYKSIDASWHKDSIVTFNLNNIQVNKNYNLFVNVRANKNYPFNNMFLIVSLEQPDKKVLVDTLEYLMANPDGSLLGDGFTDVKTSKLVYKENFKFSKKGTYKVSIQHANRVTGKVKGVDKLEGISDLGFRIESN